MLIRVASSRPQLRQRTLDRCERRRPLALRHIGRILAHRRLAPPSGVPK